MMVITGLQRLLTDESNRVAGRRIGLVTHPAAVLPTLQRGMDELQRAGVHLVALFGPEHGFDGAHADGLAVADRRDTRSGLAVYSLYGPVRTPTPAMLQGIDLLLVDLQDIGVRYYTYLSTLYLVLAGAAAAGCPVMVLDRPNPLNGLTVEGPLIDGGFESFVGIASVPVRHGMTMGELALYFNREYRLGAELTVLGMQGWERATWFDETGLPWVPTSPAMPHLSTASVYAGTCLLEGSNLSEGRGTALPFEVCGAPWLDGDALADELNARKLPGVRFRPLSFEPWASKHAGRLCHGVQIHVIERDRMQPVLLGLHVVAACRRQAPDAFEFLTSSWEGTPPHFDLLTGGARLREGIAAGIEVEALLTWEDDLARFRERSRNYWLYE